MAIQGDKLIRLREVLGLTGLSRSTLYLKMGNGTFPESVQLGERVVAWWEGKVREWMASRPKSGTRGASRAPPFSRGQPLC